MKRKLAQRLVTRARHFFQPAGREYQAVGNLIRQHAWHAALQCKRLAGKDCVEFERLLKEFLAFFCVIAVNEMAIRLGHSSEVELKLIYDRLVHYLCEGPQLSRAAAEANIAVTQLIRGEKSGFDHWFYGYWNGDLEGMRVSAADLVELEQKQIPGPTGIQCTDAGLILLVRVARFESDDESIPPSVTLWNYDSLIRQEVAAFVKDLNDLLN